MSLQQRVALRHLDAEWVRVAKPVYLQALDFTAGLIRKFDARGQQISSEATNAVLLRRILKMRSLVQEGFDLGLLVKNDSILRGIGNKALEKSDKQDQIEADMLPKELELQAFLKTYPDQDRQSRAKQAGFLKTMVERELHLSDLSQRSNGALPAIMTDRVLFNEAFAVVNIYIRGVKTHVSSLLSGAPGTFEIRDKAEQSTWDKSTKKNKIPFYFLGDLLGCRSVTNTVPEMAGACSVAQARLDIVSKDNKYLQTSGGYNAVHYAMMADGIVVEYQVKAMVNKLEAAISHELIYSDDKFRDKFKTDPLPPGEKALIRRVIDISTQLSMSDLQEYFDIPLTTTTPPQRSDILYGQDLPPAELERRVRLAHERMVRFASLGLHTG